MNLSDKEIEELLNELDEGNSSNAPEELKRDHSLIKQGIEYLQERAYHEKLDNAHQSIQKSSFLNRRFYLSTGIAASLVLALFWYSSNDATNDAIELQMNEVPAYADSAFYDSTKNSYQEVDKLEE